MTQPKPTTWDDVVPYVPEQPAEPLPKYLTCPLCRVVLPLHQPDCERNPNRETAAE